MSTIMTQPPTVNKIPQAILRRLFSVGIGLPPILGAAEIVSGVGSMDSEGSEAGGLLDRDAVEAGEGEDIAVARDTESGLREGQQGGVLEEGPIHSSAAASASATERTSAALPRAAVIVMIRFFCSLDSLSRPTLMSSSTYSPSGVQMKRSRTPAVDPS